MTMQVSQWKKQRIHFIGIGGAGMSGLARIALSHGIEVTGSDAKNSSVVVALRALGAQISIGHEPHNVDGSQVVVYSSAITSNNPEMKRAQESELEILTRAQALAILMADSRSIAVAGTHGKTTTSSMLTVALQACGVDPSFAIGGTLTSSGSNAHRGTGNYFIAEADESDGSFIEYNPFAAIVTNVEHDHVDYFHTPQAVTDAFANFALSISTAGFLVYCKDDVGSRQLGESNLGCRVISYGTDSESDLCLDQISLLPMGSRARALWKARAIGTLELQVPGIHNLRNAGAALATGLALELPAIDLLSGLHSFHGAGRRFELKGTVHGIRVVDDYGHHPTEITVTLEAARRYAGDGRLLVIFQPHRYTRTQAFLHEFATSLDLADETILLEIYAASEIPIAGMSSALIAKRMKNGLYIPNFAEAVDRVIEVARTGDVILTLGAGDVNSLAPIIVDGLMRRFSDDVQ